MCASYKCTVCLVFPGVIDAARVVSGVAPVSPSASSSSSNRRGGSHEHGGAQVYLTKQDENAALVVGGLKALDTVVWQMLASVMIPGGCL